MSISISERNNLIIENLDAIKMIARKCNIKNTIIDDLYQDAFEVSLKVIENYNSSKGSLINFLWPHIKMHLLSRNIVAPEHLQKISRKINRINEVLTSELNRKPTEKEISSALNFSTKKLNHYLMNINACERVSFDKTFSDNEDSGNLYDLNLGYSDLSPEDYLMVYETNSLIKKAWYKLSEEDRKILSYRTTYASNLSEPIPLRQLEEVYNVSRTTIGTKQKIAEQNLKNILTEYGVCA